MNKCEIEDLFKIKGMIIVMLYGLVNLPIKLRFEEYAEANITTTILF